MGHASLHDPARHSFASDNHAGVHPEVLDAIAAANGGHQAAYGGDAYTDRLRSVVRGHFGSDADVYPVFGGTGANVVALQSMLASSGPGAGAVICAASAHINTDEGGAPERVAGIKLLGVPTLDGRLTPELIDQEAWGFGVEHRAQPAVVSITQATELGTVYTPDQIRAVTEHAHELGMMVHMDGARLANAAAFLDVSLSALTVDVGVDVISLGGTKNGALAAEAVVVCNPDAAQGVKFLRKTDMQLPSKMRFVSAQLLALFDGDLWRRNAAQANAMASRLRVALEAGAADGTLPGVSVVLPTEANGVFAVLPSAVAAAGQAAAAFHVWGTDPGIARLMCSFDTTEADVDAFVAALADH